MNDDPEELAAALVELKDVTGVWDLIESRLRAGDATFVVDLGFAVWRRCGTEASPPWQYSSVFDRIMRLLTLSSGTIEHAIRLISVMSGRRKFQYVASLLASAHTVAELVPVFDSGRSEELRACLTQELVLRGAEVRHPWTVSSHWRFHPLAWLPLSLLPVEGRPGLPSYSIGGSSHDLPGMSADPVHGHGPAPGWRETTTTDEAVMLTAAVDNWVKGSNGRVEARTFAFHDEVTPDAIGGALASVGLQSAQGLRNGLGACSATQAWQQLFTAASTGGAYSNGEFGAYGRLLAWRSLTALVGARPDAPASEIDALAHRSSCYSFAGATDWFEDVAWDIGLAVVSPDRRRLAVLAATDTD